jgi:hypothetical protein
MSENSRKSTMHKWDSIAAKTGDSVTVTLTPQERAFLFATASFTSEYPQFLIAFTDEQKDAVDAFVSGIVAKLA